MTDTDDSPFYTLSGPWVWAWGGAHWSDVKPGVSVWADAIREDEGDPITIESLYQFVRDEWEPTDD